MTSIKVCKYFIKSSPVGELHEVLDDVGKVLGGNNNQEFLQTPEIREALREYYESHRLHLQLANGQSVMVSGQGRQEPIVKYVQSESPYQQPQQQQQQQTAPQMKGDTGLFDGGNDEDEYGNETVKQVEEL